jgi:signal transduction histidine kinase
MGARASGGNAPARKRPTVQVNRATREAEGFESLVDELSAAIAKAPAEAVDADIQVWLERICLALDLDRSAIYERGPTNRVRTSHTWVRPNFPDFPRNFDPERLTRKTTDWIVGGSRIVFSRATEIPAEFSDLKRFIARYGPKASAIMPMWGGDRIIGGASFGRFRSSRPWNPQVLQQLELAVRIFGGAIERKQAEEAARVTRAELALAQRRSMMAELIGSLAHELNQPLSAIMSNLGGVARLLSRGNPEPALAATAINNALEDTRRASEIIRRVRAMFKGGGKGHKVALDVRALVGDTARLIANEAALRGIEVQVDAARNVPKVLGDQVLLQQCILNLLMNAFESIVTCQSEKRIVAIEVRPESASWILINVSDSGDGIQPAIADRLFEPFVTTKKNGMGLGLLVTRSIVEEHGGRISANGNSKDGGASFAFTLPAAETKSRSR